MFFGEYAHQLDAKFRMRMPSQYKSEFDGRYAFCLEQEDTLSVYPVKEIEEKCALLKSLAPFDEEVDELYSDYASGVHIVAEDPQGRIVIPAELRKDADLGKNIVIYAARDHVCITSKERRDERKKVTNRRDLTRRISELLKNR